jgi:predicted amidohydrolase YtcJ
MLMRLLATFFFVLVSFNTHAQPTIIYNIHGHSINNDQHVQFEAIAFENGKVLKVGKQKQLLKAYPKAITIDGEGRTLLPGLQDGHGHVMNYARLQKQVNLLGAESLDDALKRIKQFADANPDSKWILGRGWNQVLWEGKQFPSKEDLDSLNINKPIWLRRIDGHAGWANSQAMQIAETFKVEKDMPGGEIITNELGVQTGIFVDNAMDLIGQHIPTDRPQDYVSLIQEGLQELASLGLTSVDDAGIDWPTYQAYKYLNQLNALPIRVNAWVHSADSRFHEMIAAGPIDDDKDFLKIHSVKYVYDGALGSRGAAMIEPYSDRKNHLGLFVQTDEFITKNVLSLIDGGWQAAIHAIGDHANKLAVDLLSKPEANSAKIRHRIEHFQVAQINDLQRLADNNIIASMQPTHATSDMNMAEDRVGKERLKGAYAWQSLIQKGAVIASGSDFPVEYPHPIYGLHAAITRQDRNNKPLHGWIPEERMTVKQALESFTYNVAYANHNEKLQGSLEPGKWADFILMDQDIFRVKPQDIWKIQIMETWVAGKKIYSKQ